jgi:hypothetical protein
MLTASPESLRRRRAGASVAAASQADASRDGSCAQSTLAAVSERLAVKADQDKLIACLPRAVRLRQCASIEP